MTTNEKTLFDIVCPDCRYSVMMDRGTKCLVAGRCKLLPIQELMIKEHKRSLIDGVTMYAWWKDGVQYVGTCGRTLKEAVARIEEDTNERKPAASPTE